MFSRRRVIQGGLLAAAAALPAWMPRLAFAQPYNDPRGDVLISVFLRGGADALNIIVPHGEETYYTARPTLAIPRPDDSTATRSLDLDGFFGLHPALAPLLPIFQGGQMRAVHATGAPHNNRSHFEAMNFMERGEMNSFQVSTGWITRHLSMLAPDEPSPVRGVGWGTALPMSLQGAPSTIAMQSIIDYHLQGDEQLAAQMLQSLGRLYALESDDDSLAQTAQATQDAIAVIQRVGYENYQPQNGAQYPETDFARALRQTAALIRADVGLEAATIDLGGWDTHAAQGSTEGVQAGLLQQLAQGLAAFHQDMGAEMSRVTLSVMSEFGRRLEENGSQGTDHGQGGAMLLMSGGLSEGAPVYSDWPTLAPDALDDGDLAITTDYRDVLSELLRKRLKNENTAAIFPEYQASERGLFSE